MNYALQSVMVPAFLRNTYTGGGGSPGVKRPRLEGDHQPPSSAGSGMLELCISSYHTALPLTTMVTINNKLEKLCGKKCRGFLQGIVPAFALRVLKTRKPSDKVDRLLSNRTPIS
jgi:hypothetical protein